MQIVACIAAALGLALAGQRDRPQVGQLMVGDPAPAFRLKALGKDEYFDLKSVLGKRPVVLIFGSYT